MSEITKSVANKVTYHDGVVSLEIRNENDFPTQYTIYVGPREKEKLGRTRVQFSEENFAALCALIDLVRASVAV